MSGIVDITGTAFSDDDFKDYQVHVGPSAVPEARQLLRSSPVPVQAEELATWNTLGLPEGDTFDLTLEAEDVIGNTASVTITVAVDNTPPAVPTGLVALATGADVRVDWDASPEPDLRGYLLFRDERLVNVDGVLGRKDSTEQTPNELALVVNRERAQQYDVNPEVVAGVVGYALRGTPLPKYRAPDGREIPVRVRQAELLEAARAKKGRPVHIRLADEFVAAFKREGAAMTKRENVHRMADANKAFAHFAW